MEKLARHGVTDVVDLTAYTNPLSYLDFLESSPVRVHPCVGFYLERYVQKAHRTLPVEGLVNVLERKRKRLSPTLPPVAIKVAAHSESLSTFERRAFDAASIFHQRTGLPIITHSPHGFEQHLDYLLNRGVSEEAIMLSHPEMSIKGRLPISEKQALESMARCAERGSYLCITDLTGIASKVDAARIRLVSAMVEAGHARRLVISGDSSWKIHRGRLSVQNSARGKDYCLVIEVHEKLRRYGISEDYIRLIVRENPPRFFGLER